MAYTHEKRDWWHLYRCTPGIELKSGFFGRTPVRGANEDVLEAWKALEKGHLGVGYIPTPGAYTGTRRNCPAGIGGKECEQDGDNCSLHNYCLAIDVEYTKNKLGPEYPVRHSEYMVFTKYKLLHKYTTEMIDGIENIRNKDGKAVFRWLGWIGDFMHWEIDLPPEELNIDWDTVPNGGKPPLAKEDTMFCEYSDGFNTADGDEVVRHWQEKLNRLGHDTGGVDGKYGSKTQAAVAAECGTDGSRIGGFESAEIDIALASTGVAEHAHPDLAKKAHTHTVTGTAG